MCSNAFFHPNQQRSQSHCANASSAEGKVKSDIKFVSSHKGSFCGPFFKRVMSHADLLLHNKVYMFEGCLHDTHTVREARMCSTATLRRRALPRSALERRVGRRRWRVRILFSKS